MAPGPGRYSHYAQAVLETTKADLVMVFVGNGLRGSGFDMVLTDEGRTFPLPKLLRDIADEIERTKLSQAD